MTLRTDKLQRLSGIIIATAAILAAACDKKGNDPEPGKTHSNVDLTGLTVDGQFPIIAWTGIDAMDTEAKFGPMKECGINVYLGWYDTQAEVMTALDNASKAGVKLIIKSDELFSSTASTVKAMKDHPALFGYHIKDEPETSDFPTLGSIVKEISAIDKDHFCYINLYPNWAWGNIDGYMSKLTSFLTQVPVNFISFDHYPIYEIDGVSYLRPEWYKNLEDIRRVSRARSLPFWAFALALSHKLDGKLYPIPTVAELRLQMFSNLAYGAQGFQYFTYWGIYQSGPTQVYERVKTVNRELQQLSKIFLGADVTEVWHTGNEIPYGTKELSAMPYGFSAISASGAGIVVSQVEKDGKIYVAMVNKDYKNTQKVSLSFNTACTRIDKEGYSAAAADGEYLIEAGDIILFRTK